MNATQKRAFDRWMKKLEAYERENPPDYLRQEGGYRFPHDADAPEVKTVRRLAAAYGRAFGRKNRKQMDAAQAKLIQCFSGLSKARLEYWRDMIMIDGRWCGASGTGAFWAVGSDMVNRVARIGLEARA